MSRARHKKAMGGSVYSGAGSNVVKETHEKRQMKKGGAVHADAAEDKKLIKKEVGKVCGDKPKKRLDKRASGGRVGSDKSPMAPGSARHPFSSAAK